MTTPEDREKHRHVDTVPIKVVPLSQAHRLKVAQDLTEADQSLADLPAEDATE